MKFKRILSSLLCVLMLTSSLVFTVSAATATPSEIYTSKAVSLVAATGNMHSNTTGSGVVSAGRQVETAKDDTEFMSVFYQYQEGNKNVTSNNRLGMSSGAVGTYSGFTADNTKVVTIASLVKPNQNFMDYLVSIGKRTTSDYTQTAILYNSNTKASNTKNAAIYEDENTGYTLAVLTFTKDDYSPENLSAMTDTLKHGDVTYYGMSLRTQGSFDYMYDYLNSNFGGRTAGDFSEPILESVGNIAYKGDYSDEQYYDDIISDILYDSRLTSSNTYTVTYDYPDGTTDKVVKYPVPGNTSQAPITPTTFNLIDPEISGFLGWKKDGTGESLDPGTSLSVGTGAVTYVADVIEGNFITFEAGNGSFADGKNYKYVQIDLGDKILENAPTDLTYAGYEFAGWSLDPATEPLIDENAVAEADYEIYKAVWNPLPGSKYEINSLKVENSANATINAKYVNAVDVLDNPALTEFTVTLPYGWPTDVMPYLEAASDNGSVAYTAPVSFENGVATGSLRIYNDAVVDQFGEPSPQEKTVSVKFEIAAASQVSDIVVDDNFQTEFDMEDKGYTVQAADTNAAPANQIAKDSIKLTLNGANLPTNLTWEFPDYLCVDDVGYVRVLAYYDSGDNKQIDTGINTASAITFGSNISGNLENSAPIQEVNSTYFNKDRWQYIYYDLTDSYGYTDSLSVELFGGKNASEYTSDDTLYIAEIALLNVDSADSQLPLRRYQPTGIVLSSNAYEGQKGVLSNLSNDMQVSTNGTDWTTIQRFAQSIGGTYSAGVLSGLDAGTYYFRYSELGTEVAASESVSFTIDADKVFLSFYDANGELITTEIADYSTTATNAFDGITTSKEAYEFLGWATSQDATEAEAIIPDANKSFYPVFRSINNVYVSADGTGDGLTEQNPTSDFAAAWDIVAVNGGTVIVVGAVDASAADLAATDKDITITGGTLNTGSGMSFAQGTGKVTFTDIAFEGTGTINLNGKEAEFTDTVTGTYTVCASESADVTGKLTLRGGEPTVNVVGSVKLISNVAYTVTDTNKLQNASVQQVAYTSGEGQSVEFSGNAYKVTAQDKYAVVKYVDGNNVSLIENVGNVTFEDGNYEVNFYATEAEIPVTINIYDGTGLLKTIEKKLGEAYSYSELTGLGVSVTIPEGKVLKSFEGDGYTLNLTDENTLSEIPENANINLNAVFAFDAEEPYWYTVGEYNEIEQLYKVEVKLAYGNKQVSAGAVGFEYNVTGLTKIGDVVYDSAVENIEGMVYENADADKYVIAFSTGAAAPITASETGVTIATMTFTLSPENYAAIDDSAFSVYVPDSANLLFNGTDKWQIISGTEDGNIYAPKYVDSYVAPHETSVAQYEMAELELTVVLEGAADGRTVTENVAKFGYKPSAGGDYKYVSLEEAGTEYNATEVYTISGIADFVKGIAYDIIVVKNGYISAEYSDVIASEQGEVPAYTATLAIGDLTADNTVNTEDFNAIVSALSATTTAQAMGQADINEDGFVTVFDIAIVKDNYGKTSSDSTITPTLNN